MSAGDEIAEAPERIWITASTYVFGRVQTWSARPFSGVELNSEYVRADLADAQAQEIARLKATLSALDGVLARLGFQTDSIAREGIRAALGDAS